jgi:hypothetical protein
MASLQATLTASVVTLKWMDAELQQLTELTSEDGLLVGGLRSADGEIGRCHAVIKLRKEVQTLDP